MLNTILEDLTNRIFSFKLAVKNKTQDDSLCSIFAFNNNKFYFHSKDKHPRLEVTSIGSLKIPDEYVPMNYLALCYPKLSL